MMSDIPLDDQAFLADLRTALATASAVDTLVAGGPPDTLLNSIVRAAARAIPCPEGALLLVDRDRGVLTFEVVTGQTAAAVEDIDVPLGHGIAGLVAVSGQALAIANAQEDPRHARDIAERSGYLPTTILAVPVTNAGGTPVGVLELLDRQGQPTFSLADMELLGIFAEQVALVLEMRRSHGLATERLTETLAALGGIPTEARDRLAASAGTFARRFAADTDARQAGDLARLVAAIASRGPSEYALCLGTLTSLADYFEATPSLGEGLFQ